jgi:iron complex outermembrane receptor protein
MQLFKRFRGFAALAIAAAVAVLLLPVSAAWAQGGVIQGAVFADQGQPLVRVQVVVKGTEHKALTDDNGQYNLSGVPPGQKTVEVAVKGFRTQTLNVTVSADRAATADFVLEPDLMGSEEIVVTAQQPDRKVRSSSAISTLNAEDIEARAPRNTAELLNVVPGFYVESSAGEVGNNLFVRGLPQDGSYRYVAMMEDGMPVFDSTELFFVNNDIFVRVDENIERMEAVRGGSAALYGSNAPGGLVNFINKSGGEKLAGTIKATGATAGLYRLDANVNGPASDNLFFSLGGFYRFDNGVRNPGFPASNGGQAKASLKYNFNSSDMSGHARLTLKYMNDRNAFYLPLPFRGRFDSSGRLIGSDFVEGFPVDGTMTTQDGVDAVVPLGNGRSVILPLDHGQQQIGGAGMAEARFYFPNGRWELQENVRYVQMDHSWNAILPFEIQQKDAWATKILPGAADYRLVCAKVAGTPEFGSAACPSDNDLVSLSGQWLVQKPVSNISNQLRLTKFDSFGSTENKFTAGVYLGRYTADNTWYFNEIVTDVRNRPHFLDLQELDAGGTVLRTVTSDGFRRYVNQYEGARGSALIGALFVGDEINLGDRLRVDLAARGEIDGYEQNVEKKETVDLGDDTTDADNAVERGTNSFDRVGIDLYDWALSAGVNYSLSESASLYVRGSRGFKMPILDQYMFVTFEPDGSVDRDNPDFPKVAETLLQAEGGIKVGFSRFALAAVAYWLQIQNFPLQDNVVVDPATGETAFVTAWAGKAQTIGAEIEAAIQPAPFFRANAALTLQDPRYTDFRRRENPNDPTVTDYNGNRIRRIPQIISDLTGTFMFRGASIGLNWSYIGHRFSNNANTVELPGFNVFNAFASYGLRNFSLDLHVHNLMDGYGLTEGNPRRDEALVATPDIFLARPVLPRRFTLSLTAKL